MAINYRQEDFVERARGTDIILDHIGAEYLAAISRPLASAGEWSSSE